MYNIKNSRFMQYTAAITATSTCICNGLALTWPSSSLPKLQSSESPIGRPISHEEGSWLVSIVLLASIPGCILGGYTIDKYGRRSNILFMTSVTCIHFIMVAFGKSFGVLLTFRCIGGISMSLAGLASTIYTSEIAEMDVRGKLGTYFVFLKTSGNLIGLVVGPYISYESLSILSASISVITIVIFYFMPETPYYLVKINKVEKSKECLKKLRSEDLRNKLKVIQQTVEKDMRNKTTFGEFLGNVRYRYAIFIMLGVKTLQQLSGSSALEAYLQPIITLSRSGIKPQIASIIIGCIQLPSVFLSSILVDKLGRRPLLITSALGCFLALFGEATYFLIQDYLQIDTNSITWLPTIGLVLFWIFNSLGISTLPYVLMGELFPTNIKEIAVAFSSVYGALLAFVVSKFFKPLSNAIGMHFVFYIFAGVCLFGSLFAFFFLPETKGKSFMEIQNIVCKE